jgi:hypothetical protein
LRTQSVWLLWIAAETHLPVCYTGSMTITPGHDRSQQDSDQLRHTLTVSEVSEQLSGAGVPRSERQIKRYCETGFLDATKIPGPTGEQWFIAPVGLPKLIGDLQQWQMQRSGQTETRPAVTATVTPEMLNKGNADTAGSGRPPQAAADEKVATEPETQVVTSGYVTQLAKRIDEKDEVIGLLKGQLVAKDQQISDLSTRFGNLSDRFADTQKLLGAMQRMFAPLLGQSDPYAATEPRGAEDVSTSRETEPGQGSVVDNRPIM